MSQALYGMVHCKILDGQVQEAAEQLDFLKEINQQGNPKNSKDFPIFRQTLNPILPLAHA